MTEPRKVTANEWIAIVNKSAHPDLDYFKLEYLNRNGKFAVYIDSGYGSFLGKLVGTKKELKKEEERLRKEYDQVKVSATPLRPTNVNSLLSF
mgnify:CR=1